MMSYMYLLKQLYGEEMVSKCCKKKIFVIHGGEGTSYYACKGCNMPCDSVNVSDTSRVV